MPIQCAQVFAAVVCATLLLIVSQRNVRRVQQSPILFSTSDTSTRAVALESVTLRAEPFKLTSEGYFSPGDSRTRIELFCMNLALLAGEGANSLTAEAEDGNGVRYPLRVEYVGQVPPITNLATGEIITDFRGISMVIVRLNDPCLRI